MTDEPRVLVAESQPAARASLGSLLDRSGFAICGEASTGAEVATLAARERPDVCVTDLALPPDGFAAIRDIASASPRTAIVVFTTSADPDDLFDAIRAGAIGYLLKGMNPERLPNAIRGVLAGEAAIPRRLMSVLVGELQSQGARRLVVGAAGGVHLTKRQSEVAGLLAVGADTATIARRLFISPVTARRHIAAIVAKLGAPDREAAARLLAGGDRSAGAGRIDRPG